MNSSPTLPMNTSMHYSLYSVYIIRRFPLLPQPLAVVWKWARWSNIKPRSCDDWREDSVITDTSEYFLFKLDLASNKKAHRARMCLRVVPCNQSQSNIKAKRWAFNYQKPRISPISRFSDFPGLIWTSYLRAHILGSPWCVCSDPSSSTTSSRFWSFQNRQNHSG